MAANAKASASVIEAPPIYIGPVNCTATKLLASIHLGAAAHQKIKQAAKLPESPVEATEHLKEAAIANQSVADVMNRSILEADLALTQAKESLRAWGLTSP